MPTKRLIKRKSHKKTFSLRKHLINFKFHYILTLLGVLVAIVFFQIQTKSANAWLDSCSSNSQCAANQVCQYDWAHRKICHTLTAYDCNQQLSGGGYCSGNLWCNSNAFGYHVSNHTCVPNCGVQKSAYGGYACGYCYTKSDCKSGQSCSNHKCS